MNATAIRFIGFALVWTVGLATCVAADWPMYRHDAQRSGVSEEVLKFPLHVAWRYQCAQPPQPAWPHPDKNLDRLDFDCAPHPVIAGGLLFFGSSADDTVRALDAKTGEEKWQFITGGPVRFAPQIVSGRVYFGSDDGRVYCLEALTGKLLWIFKAAPADEAFIGNKRMISRWPIRTGVLVDGGVVYFAAGMWPTEGIFVYALEAGTGKIIWCNDTSGDGIIRLSHGPYSVTGVNPQGALAVSTNFLVIPMGRCAPAVYDRKTGQLLNYAPGSLLNGTGGAWITIDGDKCYTLGKSFYTGVVVTRLSLPKLEIAGAVYAPVISKFDFGCSYLEGQVRAVVKDGKVTSRRAYGLIQAGSTLFLGGENQVSAEETAAPEKSSSSASRWQAPLNGRAYELAVANGRLYVATDQGEITCFAPGAALSSAAPFVPTSRAELGQAQRVGTSAFVETTADKPADKLASAQRSALNNSSDSQQSAIINQLRSAGMDGGYAVLMGDSDGRLAKLIAKETRLHALVPLLPAEAHALRSHLLRTTSLYGRGIHVWAVTNLQRLPFPQYCANAVLVARDGPGLSGAELYRLVRPVGGVLLCPGLTPARAEALIRETGAAENEVSSIGGSASGGKTMEGRKAVVRGRLEGAWDWDAKVSADQLVRWPMRLQWFGEPEASKSYDRKYQGSTVAAASGRFFGLGDKSLTAVDAYNGYVWWSRPLPFAPGGHGAGVHGNADSVYLSLGPAYFRGATNSVYFLLDARTGNQQKIYASSYTPPPAFSLRAEQAWKVMIKEKDAETIMGQVALAGDKDALTATLRSDPAKPKTAKDWNLFLDFRPPARRYGLYEDGVYHFRILAPTGGTTTIQWRAGEGGGYPPLKLSGGATATGSIVNVSLAWADLAYLGGKPPDSFGFAVALAAREEFSAIPFIPRPAPAEGLLFCNAHANGINDGWANIHLKGPPPESSARPAIIAGALSDLPEEKRKFKPMAMETWKLGPRIHPLTGRPTAKFLLPGDGCGRANVASGSMLYRAASLAIYDFAEDSGQRFIGGVRPSCGTSVIAAHGIFFAANGGGGCDCSYNFLTSVALAPAERRLNEDWAVFAEWQVDTLVRQAAINLGAPGDRRDGRGVLWLGFPRPLLGQSSPNAFGSWHNIPGVSQARGKMSMAMAVPLSIETLEGGGPFRFNADRRVVSGTDRPWLYASGYRGIRRAGLQLNLFKPLVARQLKAPLVIDSRLNEADWAGAPEGEMVTTRTKVYLRYDEQQLYLATAWPSGVDAGGRPQKGFNTSVTNRDQGVGLAGDWLELFLSDAADTRSVYLGVSAGGAQSDALSKSNEAYNVGWNAVWSSAVTADTNALTVELAIPWKVLSEVGLDRNTLALNVQMSSRWNIGEALVSLGGQGRARCGNFVPVHYDALKPPAARAFTVRLHFAEPDNIGPGQRVFDVKLQGQTVLKNFDIVKEAGGIRTALVKEFKGVRASEALTLEFVPAAQGLKPENAPLICALELAEETAPNK